MDEGTLSVAEVLRRAGNGIAREMRGQVWVQGELRSIKDHRGSWYFTLVEPRAFQDGGDVLLDGAAWPRRKTALEAQLREVGLQLVAGMHVRMRGLVGLSKVGKVQLELYELDVAAMVGAQEAERRRLLRSLQEAGLLERNGMLPVPVVPLRIAVVTSEGSDGHRDFAGELERSGYAFHVTLFPSPVQGPAAPAALARAIDAASELDGVDVVAVVRGGGGELDAFDREPVARAIARSSVPVWTGIGHSSDRSVADEVANRSCTTPTACGQALAAHVRQFVERVDRAALTIARRSAAQLPRAVAQQDALAEQVQRAAALQLERAAASLRHHATHVRASARAATSLSWERAAQQARTVAMMSERAGAAEAARLVGAADQLRRTARHRLAAAARELDLRRLHVTSSDPLRPLRLGYALVRSADGRAVRSVHQVHVGELLHAVLHDGEVRSTIDAIAPSPSVVPSDERSSPQASSGAGRSGGAPSSSAQASDIEDG